MQFRGPFLEAWHDCPVLDGRSITTAMLFLLTGTVSSFIPGPIAPWTTLGLVLCSVAYAVSVATARFKRFRTLYAMHQSWMTRHSSVPPALKSEQVENEADATEAAEAPTAGTTDPPPPPAEPPSHDGTNKSGGARHPWLWVVLASVAAFVFLSLVMAQIAASGEDALIYGIYLGVVLGSVALAAFGGFFLVYFLARKNLFFTLVQEGQAKTIKKFGKFYRCIMVYRDHVFDEEWDVHHEGEIGKTIDSWWNEKEGGYTAKTVKFRPRPKSLGGIFWVGIPPFYTVHHYVFRFMSFRQITDEKTGELKEIVVAREEDIDYILVQDDAYYTKIKGAETHGMVPVNIDLLVTVRIVNPYKALYRAEEWLEQIINTIKPSVRAYVAGREYEDLIKKDETLNRTLDEVLRRSAPKEGESSKNQQSDVLGLAEYVERNYGARIKKLGFVNIQPDEDDVRGVNFVAEASRKWRASREREEVNIKAMADEERMERVYAAVRRHGTEGLTIRYLESIDRAGQKEGNWVIPLSLKEFFAGIRGALGKGEE